jgi:hypothetical protein
VESEATMLGGPSFVEEVRAQLAAAAALGSVDDDEDPFAPESGLRTAVKDAFMDDEPARQDPLADPVIAAILAADYPPIRAAWHAFRAEQTAAVLAAKLP